MTYTPKFKFPPPPITPRNKAYDLYLLKLEYSRETHIITCGISCAKLKKIPSCICNCHAGQKRIDKIE